MTGGGSVAYYLRQAALEMVIAEQMRVRAVISVHRGLLGGATVAEIAQVTGQSAAEVVGGWRSWADGQRRLNEWRPRLGMSREEYDLAAAAIDGGDGAVDRGESIRCSCRVTDEQIGSPRP